MNPSSQAALPFSKMPVADWPQAEDYSLRLPDYLAELHDQYGPIFRRRTPQGMSFFGPYMVYMIGPEANRFVLHTGREHFSHDQGWSPQLGDMFAKGLLNTDDPEHAHQRRMMNPAFAIAYMQRYLPIMERVIKQYSADWASRGTVDIFSEMRKITFAVAAESLAGVQTGEIEQRLRKLFTFILYPDFSETQTQDEMYMTYMQVRQELNDLLLHLIAERRQTPQDDILGMLVRATDDDGRTFSDTEILGQVQILLVAGHETTTTMSSVLLNQLARHPQYLDQVRQEITTVLTNHNGQITLDALRAMSFLGHCIDEAGRISPPVGMVPRGVASPFVFGGYEVPANVQVRLCIAGSHHMPSVFANPIAYDPTRFAPPREEDKRTPYGLIPFGGGPRICIGINFAQLEIKAIASLVLPHFDLTPVPGTDPQVLYYSLVGTFPEGVPMQISERAGQPV